MFGGLHVLINNAGIFVATVIEHTPVEEWDRIMDINARGVFLGIKHAIPAMRESGGGSIVNISSAAGLVANPMEGAYTASKGAVRLMTKSAAIQAAKDGIRVNSVHPGFIDTEMIAFISEDPEAMAEIMPKIPLGRSGTSEDVAMGVRLKITRRRGSCSWRISRIRAFPKEPVPPVTRIELPCS